MKTNQLKVAVRIANYGQKLVTLISNLSNFMGCFTNGLVSNFDSLHVQEETLEELQREKQQKIRHQIQLNKEDIFFGNFSSKIFMRRPNLLGFELRLIIIQHIVQL